MYAVRQRIDSNLGRVWASKRIVRLNGPNGGSLGSTRDMPVKIDVSAIACKPVVRSGSRLSVNIGMISIRRAFRLGY